VRPVSGRPLPAAAHKTFCRSSARISTSSSVARSRREARTPTTTPLPQSRDIHSANSERTRTRTEPMSGRRPGPAPGVRARVDPPGSRATRRRDARSTTRRRATEMRGRASVRRGVATGRRGELARVPPAGRESAVGPRPRLRSRPKRRDSGDLFCTSRVVRMTVRRPSARTHSPSSRTTLPRHGRSENRRRALPARRRAPLILRQLARFCCPSHPRDRQGGSVCFSDAASSARYTWPLPPAPSSDRLA
jgi:hypothetical protein